MEFNFVLVESKSHTIMTTTTGTYIKCLISMDNEIAWLSVLLPCLSGQYVRMGQSSPSVGEFFIVCKRFPIPKKLSEGPKKTEPDERCRCPIPSFLFGTETGG
jgi:hypothetical protein